MGIFDRLKGYFNQEERSFSVIPSFSRFNNSISTTRQLQQYELSTYVYACVKARAEKVGQVEFTLFKNRDEILEHPILNLLAKPNSFQSKDEFFELYQTYKDLTGSAYIVMLREGNKVTELHLLRPDWITERLFNKETSEIVAYKYRPNGGKEVLIEATDVIASHHPNPLNQRAGLSPLQAGALSIDTERQLGEYQNNILRNGGKVGSIITIKDTKLTKQQIEEIREQFEEKQAGARNAGRPLITYGGMEYQEYGLKPDELSFIESRGMTRDDICAIFRVPKAIIAQTDDVNFANAKMAREIFLSETIKPLLDNLVNKLNEFLVPQDLELSFFDPTPEDVELKMKQAESGLRNNYMTINEARAINDLEPIEDGNSILIPYNLMPMGADEYEEEKSIKKKQFSHPLQKKEFRQDYYAKFLRELDKEEKRTKREMRKVFKDQEKRLIEKLENEQVKNIKKKGIFDYFNKELEISIAKGAIIPILTRIFKKGGEDAFRLFNVDDEFDISAKDQTVLANRVELLSREMTNTTLKELENQFNLSLSEGESRRELIKRIENTYKEIDKARLNTIARTETIVAVNSGKFSGYEDMGIPIKIWTAVMDSVTRESHADIDGEERPIRDTFSNGLMFPADPTGEAGEVINCRCTI